MKKVKKQNVIDFKTRIVKLSDCKPYSNNTKLHNKKQIEYLERSLKEVGYLGAVILDKNNEILVGHGRVEALMKTHPGSAKIKVIDASHLTQVQSMQQRIFDNKSQEMTGHDTEKLTKELNDIISKMDFNLDDEYDKLMEEIQGVTAIEDKIIDTVLLEREFGGRKDVEDDIPKVPKKTKTKKGDLYILGNHRLLCGDSTKEKDVKKLMNGKKADMGFFDPPYGIKYQSNGRTASKKFDVLKGDDKINGNWIPLVIDKLNDNSAIYICTRWDVYSKWENIIKKNIKIKNVIVWDKVDWSNGDLKGDYSPRHEFIIYCVKGRHILRGHRDSNIWQFGAPNKQGYLHPTQKKVEVPLCAINKSSDSNNIIIDYFLGSGSTIIACEKTNRICYGMELDTHYCDVIIQRYVNYTGNTKIIKNGKKIVWAKTKVK